MPEVPIVFLYREPIEVLASHLVTSSAVCLRSGSMMHPDVRKLLGVATHTDTRDAPKEQRCAAYVPRQ